MKTENKRPKNQLQTTQEESPPQNTVETAKDKISDPAKDLPDPPPTYHAVRKIKKPDNRQNI